MGGIGNFIARQQWQVEKGEKRAAAAAEILAATRRARRADKILIEAGIGGDGSDLAGAGIVDAVEAQAMGAAAGTEFDLVGRIERKARGRQREVRRLARGPGLHQQTRCDGDGLALIEHQRQRGLRHAIRRAHQTARLRQRLTVVGVGVDIGDAHRERQIGFLRAREREAEAGIAIRQHQIGFGQRGCLRAAAGRRT